MSQLSRAGGKKYGRALWIGVLLVQLKDLDWRVWWIMEECELSNGQLECGGKLVGKYKGESSVEVLES